MTDQPVDPSALHTGDDPNWERPTHCRCKKIRYRTEQEARQSPGLPADQAHLPFRVYRCPGSRSWHIATRGFSPANLRSTARVAAFYLLREGEITVLELVRRGTLLGITSAAERGTPKHSKRMKRVRRTMRDLATLGVVTPGDTVHSPYRPLDRAGLARVIEVGLAEYAAERAAGRVADPEQDPSLAAALQAATAPWRRDRNTQTAAADPTRPPWSNQ